MSLRVLDPRCMGSSVVFSPPPPPTGKEIPGDLLQVKSRICTPLLRMSICSRHHVRGIVVVLQEVLRAASSVVFSATRGRANFRSVTVLVPPSWSPAACPLLSTLHNATGENWDNADLRVTQERHPHHGPRPWTLHTRGCGQSGDYISLGQELLLQNNSLANGECHTLYHV